MRDIRKNQEYAEVGFQELGSVGNGAFSFVFCCYVRKELIGTGDV